MVVDDSDAALVRAAQKGEAAAFGRLYERYRDQVFRYCHARSRSESEAEDLLSEVFLKAMESLGRYRERGVPFLAFLYRVARNASIDRSRRVTPGSLFELVVEPASSQNVEAEAGLSLEVEGVRRALGALKPDQREVLLLRFVEGYPAAEVARLLDRSEKQIWNLQQRALERVRKVLS